MKIIQELAGAFIDNALQEEDYLFSYKNTRNEIYNFYEKRLKFAEDGDIRSLKYADIVRISISESSKFLNHQWINISTDDYDTKLMIDQGSGKYLDIFPMYRFLTRRVHTDRRKKESGTPRR
jgi:hypothetical protein